MTEKTSEILFKFWMHLVLNMDASCFTKVHLVCICVKVS